jgi:hypothetical protein
MNASGGGSEEKPQSSLVKAAKFVYQQVLIYTFFKNRTHSKENTLTNPTEVERKCSHFSK